MTNFYDWSKLKGFTVNKINVTSKLKFFLGWVENIAGKGENAAYQHILLFLHCFQKPFSSAVLEFGIVW